MKDHEQDVLTVLNEFFVSVEEGFISPRADKEIQQYKEFIEAGKRGAAKRWAKGGHSPPITPPNAGLIATNNHNPLPINHKPKKVATSVACPPDVGIQEWEDWLALRKAKKAPVTETVLKSARKEAEKAGISLNSFLTIWCARGSQGLQAEWLKPNERQTFAQQAADIARTTVPAANTGPDPALVKIEQDRVKAAPMPEHIRQQINSVLRKA